VEVLLSFTAPLMSAEERTRIIGLGDEDKDQRYTRYEFIGLCAETMSLLSVEDLQGSLNNYQALQESRQKRTIQYWRSVANSLDRKCRFWFPFWYVTGIFLIFMLEIDDGYNDSTQPMYKELDGAKISFVAPDGLGEMLKFLFLPWGVSIAFTICLSFVFSCAFQARRDRQRAAELETFRSEFNKKEAARVKTQATTVAIASCSVDVDPLQQEPKKQTSCRFSDGRSAPPVPGGGAGGNGTNGTVDAQARADSFQERMKLAESQLADAESRLAERNRQASPPGARNTQRHVRSWPEIQGDHIEL